jgi:saccharopine dehydrogenase (NAD+, L-lysine-forming)
VLVVGTGGVGSAFALIAQRREAFEHIVLADLDGTRPAALVERLGEPGRFGTAELDASDRASVDAAIREARPDAVLNATDPRFNQSIFDACLDARVTYLDMAMTLSHPHPDRPYEQVGVKLGDYQFARDEAWRDAGVLALVGVGVEPGLSDVFARYAADHLFAEIDEVGIRDGANLVVDGYDFAPTFSIWTTIEECLNPPVIWEQDRGWYTTAPFSEPELFDFPNGIGPVECVNVEHEEVLLVPRWVDCKREPSSTGSARSSSTSSRRCTSSDSPRRCQCACEASTWHRATSSRPRFPIRRRSATGCTERRAPARW